MASHSVPCEPLDLVHHGFGDYWFSHCSDSRWGTAAAAATITLRRIARSVVVSFVRHPTGYRFQFTEEDSPWQNTAVQRRFVSLFLG